MVITDARVGSIGGTASVSAISSVGSGVVVSDVVSCLNSLLEPSPDSVQVDARSIARIVE